MGSPLNPIVQKMIDAGESEENIATVIQHYKQQTPSGVVSPNEPGTFMGGFVKSIKDQFAQAVGPDTSKQDPFVVHGAPPAVEKTMSTPLFHPTGIDAVDGFTSPAGLSMMAAGGLSHIAESPAARGRVGQGLQFIGENADITKPLKFLSKVGEKMANSAEDARRNPPRTMAQVYSEKPAPPPLPQESVTPPAPAAPVGLSDADRALLAKKYPGLDPAKAEAALQQIHGPLQPVPQQRPPIAVSPESPMQAPRVDIGAEKVGRQQGLTKQAVRDQTAPILTEAQGEASPVFPQGPFDRMHDTLKALPRGGPEREAYVRSAADPKTAGLLETMRRTLERNGIALGGIGSAEALRRAVLQRLDSDGGTARE